MVAGREERDAVRVVPVQVAEQDGAAERPAFEVDPIAGSSPVPASSTSSRVRRRARV